MNDLSPELHYFSDDGLTPNNELPLLIYRKVTECQGDEAAKFFEENFFDHGWTHSWRDEVYNYNHFHSNAYEALGVFQGSATLRLGGDEGETVHVQTGDVILIPPGVGHKCLQQRDGFQVVGAYADGRDWDMKTEISDKHQVRQNIDDVPVPKREPVYGKPFPQILSSLEH